MPRIFLSMFMVLALLPKVTSRRSLFSSPVALILT